MPLFEIASFYFEAKWCQIIFLFDIRFVVFVNFAEDILSAYFTSHCM